MTVPHSHLPPEPDPVDAIARQDLRELFALEALVGRGPGSLVYRARDLEYDQPVAVKVIPRAPGDGPAVEDAFHRAAARVAALEHPRIVPLYSAGASDRLFWWSMPYVEGRSLADQLQNGTAMELDACVALAGQVADALDFANRLGVTHAGLTPGNVLVDADGHATVTDFWVPWALAEAGGSAGGRGADGAAPYLAPEQRLRREAGPASDQYALASVVYACLTGAPPPVEDAMAAIAAGRAPATPPRLGDLRPDLRPGVSTAVERAMSRSPEGRYATALEFAAALRREPSPVHGASMRLTGYEVLGHPAQGANWRWVPAGLLTLVALGAVVAPWLLSSGPPVDQPRPADTTPALPSPRPEDSLGAATAQTLRPDTVVRAPTAAPTPPPVVAQPAPRRASTTPPSSPRPAPAAPAAPVRRASGVPDRASPGRLFVNAAPWGQVYVDGELVGNTPQIALLVPPGPHQLRVVRDGFEPYEVAIRVAPGQELRFTDIVLREAGP